MSWDSIVGVVTRLQAGPWVPEVLLWGTAAGGHEGDHLSPSSAEIKNEWSYTCTLPVCLCGVHRNNCGFTIILTLQRIIYKYSVRTAQ
jgi:hypothetical protein